MGGGRSRRLTQHHGDGRRRLGCDRVPTFAMAGPDESDTAALSKIYMPLFLPIGALGGFCSGRPRGPLSIRGVNTKRVLCGLASRNILQV